MTTTPPPTIPMDNGVDLAPGAIIEVDGERGEFRLHRINLEGGFVDAFGGPRQQWRSFPISRIKVRLTARRIARPITNPETS